MIRRRIKIVTHKKQQQRIRKKNLNYRILVVLRNAVLSENSWRDTTHEEHFFFSSCRVCIIILRYA